MGLKGTWYYPMSDKLITLQIPDDLYERVEQAARASQRSPETVLLESIDVLFGTSSDDLEQTLAAMSAYSEAQLWAVVYRRLPWTQSLRLHELSAKAKLIKLTSAEQSELDNLLNQVDQAMLLRSEALLLLQQRGVDIQRYLKLTA